MKIQQRHISTASDLQKNCWHSVLVVWTCRFIDIVYQRPHKH